MLWVSEAHRGCAREEANAGKPAAGAFWAKGLKEDADEGLHGISEHLPCHHVRDWFCRIHQAGGCPVREPKGGHPQALCHAAQLPLPAGWRTGASQAEPPRHLHTCSRSTSRYKSANNPGCPTI